MLRSNQKKESSRDYNRAGKKKRRSLLNSKKNINSRKYGQVKLRPSRRGVYSCLFAILAILCQLVMFYYAYKTYGALPTYVGSIGLIVVCGCGMGIYYGINGFREREKNYWPCKIGIVLNGLIIISYILLFVRGLIL